MIITYRNFCTSSFVITSWWSLHTATFPLLSLYKTTGWSLYTATFELPPLLKLFDDHYKPQLLHFLFSYNFMMIIICRNFSLSSFVITTWWSLYTATFHFLLCYNFMMIITSRNFYLSSFVITSWWSLHTATFPFPPLL